LGNRSAAEEALANTYARVVERFEQFQWQAVGVYPWLRMVALRIALDQLRKKKRELLFDAADLEREIEAASSTEHSAQDLEALDLARGREQVHRVLARINPRYAAAIRMRVLEERSREDAAAELDVSVATFDVVLHRALGALKKALTAELGSSRDQS
jgi:RNA polymerase sigma-70 factor (ECF subfamily)